MGEEKLSPIEETKKVLAELKIENDRREKLLSEEQRLQSEKLLSGTAGGRVEPKEPEIDNKDYARQVLAGKLNAK